MQYLYLLKLVFSYFKILAHLVYNIRHKNALNRVLEQLQHISNIHSYNTRSSALKNFYTQTARAAVKSLNP